MNEFFVGSRLDYMSFHNYCCAENFSTLHETKSHAMFVVRYVSSFAYKHKRFK